MFRKRLLMAIALGGGVVVGGALAAFITLIKLIPRLIQKTETENYVKFYEFSFGLGSISAIGFYFSKFSLGLGKVSTGLIGLIMGIFVGLFSSALAEVLNVIPVLSKKLKLKKDNRYIIYVLTFGKVIGSLYFWLFY